MYSALSLSRKRLVRGKEYFCLDWDMFKECLERSRSAINKFIQKWTHTHSINANQSTTFSSTQTLQTHFHSIARLSVIVLQNMQANRAISGRFGIVQSRILGKGSTGSVFLGYELSNPQRRVAIKDINLKQVDNQVTKYLLGCEITALNELAKMEGQVGNENVVRLLQVVSQSDHIYLVTQLLEGGTLAQYIKMHPTGLNQEEALILFGQMLKGYNLIRNKRIIHRDLKPDNILFRSRSEYNKTIAIIDFGYCDVAEVGNKPQVYYNVGSPKYMAPEAHEDSLYSQKSDMWALGVILYQMVVGRTCDEGHNIKSYLEMIRNNGITLPNNLGPLVKSILQKLLCYSHDQRYNCPQILEIIREFDNNRIQLQKKQEYQVNFQIPQKNFIFRSTFMNPHVQVSRNLKIPHYQISPRRSKSPVPKEKIMDYSNEKHLVRYNSAKVMPLFTFKNIVMQPQQSFNSNINNIQNSILGNDQTNKNVINNNLLNGQYFPQRFMQFKGSQVSHINKPKINNKINFNIVDLRKVSPQKGIRHPQMQYKFNTSNDKINLFDYYRQQRISTQPQQIQDQNSIKMHIARNNQIKMRHQYLQQYHNRKIISRQKNKKYLAMASPQKSQSIDRNKIRFVSQNKLIGGFSLHNGSFFKNGSKIQDNRLRVSIVYPSILQNKQRINSKPNSKPNSPSFNQNRRKVGFIY